MNPSSLLPPHTAAVQCTQTLPMTQQAPTAPRHPRRRSMRAGGSCRGTTVYTDKNTCTHEPQLTPSTTHGSCPVHTDTPNDTASAHSPTTPPKEVNEGWRLMSWHHSVH